MVLQWGDHVYVFPGGQRVWVLNGAQLPVYRAGGADANAQKLHGPDLAENVVDQAGDPLNAGCRSARGLNRGLRPRQQLPFWIEGAGAHEGASQVNADDGAHLAATL